MVLAVMVLLLIFGAVLREEDRDEDGPWIEL